MDGRQLLKMPLMMMCRKKNVTGLVILLAISVFLFLHFQSNDVIDQSIKFSKLTPTPNHRPRNDIEIGHERKEQLIHVKPVNVNGRDEHIVNQEKGYDGLEEINMEEPKAGQQIKQQVHVAMHGGQHFGESHGNNLKYGDQSEGHSGVMNPTGVTANNKEKNTPEKTDNSYMQGTAISANHEHISGQQDYSLGKKTTEAEKTNSTIVVKVETFERNWKMKQSSKQIEAAPGDFQGDLDASSVQKTPRLNYPVTDAPDTKNLMRKDSEVGVVGGSKKRTRDELYEFPGFVKVVDKRGVVPEEKSSNLHALLQLHGVVPNLPVREGMPKTIHRISDVWQVVQDSWEIYLFSAWYDDRPTISAPAIRVIVVAEEQAKHLYCLHWYHEEDKPDATMAEITPVGPKIVPIGNKKYEQYLLSCKLVPLKGAPKFVSIITPNNVVPTTLLRVQIPDKNPDKVFEFGQCMSVVYWHHDPVRVVEWLELNKMFGVGEVTVYNNSLSDEVSKVFLHYAEEGYVDFRQLPNILNHPSEFVILLNMSPAINDCMYRNMYRYKHIVCYDLDEVIFPRGFNTYSEVLEASRKAQNLTHPHQCYMFRNAYFFDDFGPVNEEPWFLWTQMYLKRIKPSQFGYSVKSFTDPMACIGLQNHVCWKRVPKYEDTEWNTEVYPKFGMNHHYKKCHFDKFLKKKDACKEMMYDSHIDKAALAFGSKLYDSVAKKLLELELVDEANESEREEALQKLEGVMAPQS